MVTGWVELSAVSGIVVVSVRYTIGTVDFVVEGGPVDIVEASGGLEIVV